MDALLDDRVGEIRNTRGVVVAVMIVAVGVVGQAKGKRTVEPLCDKSTIGQNGDGATDAKRV